MPTQLTAAQLSTFRTNVQANVATVQYNGAPIAINTLFAQTSDGAAMDAIAWWYNLIAVADFFANHSKVPLSDIKNKVSWKNFTPTDACPTTPDLTVQVFMARATLAQSFMLNLQAILSASNGNGYFDATKSSQVQGLKDATNTSMPTGAAGANQTGGWSGAGGIIAVLCRKATNAEKVFADTSGGSGGTTTTAATTTFEGNLTGEDVLAARP